MLTKTLWSIHTFTGITAQPSSGMLLVLPDFQTSVISMSRVEEKCLTKPGALTCCLGAEFEAKLDSGLHLNLSQLNTVAKYFNLFLAGLPLAK